MSYAKAHPFGYKAKKTMSKEEMKERYKEMPLSHKQTIIESVSYKVLRRKPVVEVRPNGKKKTYYVPVLDAKGEPIYDTFTRVETRVLCHYGREHKGRTLAQMVYDTYLKSGVK